MSRALTKELHREQDSNQGTAPEVDGLADQLTQWCKVTSQLVSNDVTELHCLCCQRSWAVGRFAEVLGYGAGRVVMPPAQRRQ